MSRVNAILIPVLLLAVIAHMGVAVHQQSMIVVNQRVQMKLEYHRGLIALLSLTDDAGLSKLFFKDAAELTVKERNLVGLLIQRLVIAKDVRPAFSDTEWQALVQEGKEAFTLPVFQTQWSNVRGFYDEETVNFMETTFLP